MQSATPPKTSPYRRNHRLRDAIGQALHDAMAADPSIHLFGEGCEVKIHYDAPAIERDFPDRCHTLPISEDGNVNFCVGAALMGVKPVVDIISADFLYRAMDSICNTAAKANFARPDLPITLVIRAEFLSGGPTTGQRPEALFAHIPGLNVVIPSTPRDAYGLMWTALDTPGVTLFFEDREIQDDLLSVADQRLLSRIGFYALERSHGNVTPDVTIVTYGLMRQVVEQAVPPDWNVDIIDLRCIWPLDFLEILQSVRRSGKLLIVEPDVQFGGVGAEIVAQVAERMPHVRVKRLGAPRSTTPASPALHDQMLPTDEEIIHAITSDW